MNSYEEVICHAQAINNSDYSSLFENSIDYILRFISDWTNESFRVCVTNLRGPGYCRYKNETLYLYKPNILEYFMYPNLERINRTKIKATEDLLDKLINDASKRKEFDSRLFVMDPLNSFKCRIVMMAHFIFCTYRQGINNYEPTYKSLSVGTSKFNYKIVWPPNYLPIKHDDGLKPLVRNQIYSESSSDSE